jgi:acetoin utilization deacetylase AcuC-like enzyme
MCSNAREMWIGQRLRRGIFGGGFALYHDPAYRLPLQSLEARTGFDARRAQNAASFLLETGAISPLSLRAPRRADYGELARVHDPELLESLDDPATLARIYSVDPGEVRPAEVMGVVRLACGATIDAAREVLRPRGRIRRALNLSGGFHHAGRRRAGGFCPVNDVAAAVAAIRHDGFRGRVSILDLDAHPPDGIADCLRDDPAVFIGSISGEDLGPLPGVDETVLAKGADDAAYLASLQALLGRMPAAQIAFVVAGGDVLRGDVLGNLSLTLEGARRRDLLVARVLEGVPSVWVAGGGYSADAWRALAGTGLALAVRSAAPIPRKFDPLAARYGAVASALTLAELGSPDAEEELLADLRVRHPHKLLLGLYSSEGLELALDRYGFLGELRRLGYGRFRVVLSPGEIGDRVQLFGTDPGGREHLLVELVVERQNLGAARVLYVHWLTMRHPLARFSEGRPPLPGQEVPGLGLAREMAVLLEQMARRLGLEGVAFRPASFHTAYAGRGQLRFLDPERQGRFEALLRDLAGLPLGEATAALAEGRVRLAGEPYSWEPDEMVLWLRPGDDDREAVGRERERARFEVSRG